MKIKIKLGSLYAEITIMLLISAAAALLFFFAADNAASTVIDSYVRESGYMKKCADKRAEMLQEYVTKKSLSSENITAIEKWLSRYRDTDIMIFNGKKLIYSGSMSEYGYDEPEYDDYYFRGSSYEITFADKPLTVQIIGMYDYSLYIMVMVFDILISTTLFLLVFLLGIRRKIRYIRKLRQEIQILEGGSLDCKITVSGSDELSELAKGLDAMRLSFIRQMEDAEYLANTNKAIVSEVSHDLRTPLTAVLLYSDILRSNASLTDEQRSRYIEKIIKKLRHMEELSDHLLKYASGESADIEIKPKYEAISIKQALFDELSEFCGYLSEQGFETDFTADWKNVNIRADDESLSRIFNNISSNICKYADKSFPVSIKIDYSKSIVGLRIENAVLKQVDRSDSTGIGMGSISDTVHRIGGNFFHFDNGEKYIVSIEFMICE